MRTRTVVDELRSERIAHFGPAHREKADALLSRASDGVVITLSGLPGSEGAVVREEFSSVAIGLAGRYAGFVVDGQAVWDPSARTWYG
jgi:hypothetical protein